MKRAKGDADRSPQGWVLSDGSPRPEEPMIATANRVSAAATTRSSYDGASQGLPRGAEGCRIEARIQV
jgi:hypothetical protein